MTKTSLIISILCIGFPIIIVSAILIFKGLKESRPLLPLLASSTNKEISTKEKLLKEKIHIEKTIDILNQRLDYVCSELRDIEEE